MPGVVAQILRCDGVWCRLEADGYKGWLKRSDFYGVYPDEKLQ
jgi:SH3-like domain-containing protein